MGKKACLVASYGPSYLEVLAGFTVASCSQIIFEFVISVSFGTLTAETSSVSMQQCEEDFYNFIGYSGTLEIFGSQNGQRCLIIELCDSNAITAYCLHNL